MKKTSAQQKEEILLKELLKDSSRSDRELAKTIGTSQPTISRLRKKLDNDNLIKNYTVIPDFYKMGYTILAITMVKSVHNLASSKEKLTGKEKAKNWMMKYPNIIFCDYCRGIGMDGVMFSLHKSYNDFDKFMSEHNHALGNIITDFENILVNLKKEESIKPFNLKYLAEDI